MKPFAEIYGETLVFLASNGWISETEYRWVDETDPLNPVESVKTIDELNEMGYWPVEFSSPPDTENQYTPVWFVDDGMIKVESWNRLPPSSDYIAQVASLSFVKQAENSDYDDTTVFEHKLLFNVWNEQWTGKQNQIVQESVEGKVHLYRSRHDVLTPAQNTRPSETPSMWQEIGDPNEEFPAWAQPIGAGDEYGLGAKCSHNAKKWVSVAANNIWEPGVYGWDEVK